MCLLNLAINNDRLVSATETTLLQRVQVLNGIRSSSLNEVLLVGEVGYWTCIVHACNTEPLQRHRQVTSSFYDVTTADCDRPPPRSGCPQSLALFHPVVAPISRSHTPPGERNGFDVYLTRRLRLGKLVISVRACGGMQVVRSRGVVYT